MKVVTAGHACVDVTPILDTSPGTAPGVLYPVGPLKFTLGGSAINTARTLSGLGAEVSMAIARGHDLLDLIYQRLLSELGIVGHAVDTELSTSYSIVVEHGGHDRTFWQHEGFNAAFDPRKVELENIEPDLFHVGYPSLVPFLCLNPSALAEAFQAARAREISTSLDLAHVGDGSVASRVDWVSWFARTLAHVDVISPSWDDLSSAMGLPSQPSPQAMREIAEQLIAWGAAVVQISAGSRGFLLRTANAERLARGGSVVAALGARWADQDLWFDAERIESPRTTVGAGDALTAGLIYSVGEGLEPSEAGGFARSVVGRHLRGEV